MSLYGTLLDRESRFTLVDKSSINVHFPQVIFIGLIAWEHFLAFELCYVILPQSPNFGFPQDSAMIVRTSLRIFKFHVTFLKPSILLISYSG